MESRRGCFGFSGGVMGVVVSFLKRWRFFFSGGVVSLGGCLAVVGVCRWNGPWLGLVVWVVLVKSGLWVFFGVVVLVVFVVGCLWSFCERVVDCLVVLRGVCCLWRMKNWRCRLGVVSSWWK